MTGPDDRDRAGLSFPKHDRLLRRFEFVTAQAKGRRVHAPHFVLLLLDRGDGEGPRLGVTASRRSANSVGRNRVRRLVREVFRHHREAFPRGHDCVVIVRENVPDLALAAVRDELLGALAGRRFPRRSPESSPGPPGVSPSSDTKSRGAATTPKPARGGGPPRR
jgi:ribonuclease P protein component